ASYTITKLVSSSAKPCGYTLLHTAFFLRITDVGNSWLMARLATRLSYQAWNSFSEAACPRYEPRLPLVKGI
ncbi:MAG: hypothetical protein ACP5VQ_11525, partial [Phycisphaerae bacterium]